MAWGKTQLWAGFQSAWLYTSILITHPGYWNLGRVTGEGFPEQRKHRLRMCGDGSWRKKLHFFFLVIPGFQDFSSLNSWLTRFFFLIEHNWEQGENISAVLLVQQQCPALSRSVRQDRAMLTPELSPFCGIVHSNCVFIHSQELLKRMVSPSFLELHTPEFYNFPTFHQSHGL